MAADNPFMDAWTPSLDAAGDIMGEQWSYKEQRFDAISIDDLTTGVTVAPGGRFRDSTLAILISESVKAASGIKELETVRARGQKLKVATITDDGDGSYWLMCGPASVKAPQI